MNGGQEDSSAGVSNCCTSLTELDFQDPHKQVHVMMYLRKPRTPVVKWEAKTTKSVKHFQAS